MRPHTLAMTGALVCSLLCACVTTGSQTTQVPEAIEVPTEVATETIQPEELLEPEEREEPEAAVEGPTATPIEPEVDRPELRRLEEITGENAAEVAQIALLGKGTAEQVTYSPDGRSLAVASSLGIYVYDSQTGAEVGFIPTDVWVESVVYSPDSTLLAAGSDGFIQVLRVGDGEVLWTQELMFIVGPQTMAFSPDGALLATAGHRSPVIPLWQVSDGTQAGHLIDKLGAHISVIAFSPDGMTLAAGSEKGVVDLWRVSDKARLHTSAHGSWVTTLAFTSDGTTLTAGFRDGTVLLMQAGDGTVLHTLERGDWVHSSAWAPDGQTLAVARRSSIALFRVTNGTLSVRPEVTRLGNPIGVVFAPDGIEMVSLQQDGTLLRWQVSDGTVLQTLEGHLGRGIRLAFAPDGTTLISGSYYGGAVRLWSTSDGTQLSALVRNYTAMNALALSPDGATLAMAASRRSVVLRRLPDGEPLPSLTAPDGFGIASLAFSPDGATLTALGRKGEVHRWHVSDWSPLDIPEPVGIDVYYAALSPDGEVLAVAGLFEGLELWRVSDWTLLRALEGSGPLAISPDGQLLASASSVRRLLDGERLHSFGVEDQGRTLGLAFSPDGALIATQYQDGIIRLWGVQDGSLLVTLEGHVPIGKAFSDSSRIPFGYLAFSPDGTLLASGASDGTIRLWGIAP